MVYLLLGIVGLFALVLLLRLRIRLDVSSERKLLFVGIGRTGPEIDFAAKRGTLRIAGITVKRFELRRAEKRKIAEEKVEPEEVGKVVRAGAKRRRSTADIIALFPQAAGAIWKYLTGLLAATIVERVDGEIEAGFASPHLTGQAFGYYQAALAAVPGILSRIRYTPDWSGASFSGAVRASVAWPLYRLAWETIVLVARLPLRKVIKLAIGTKEGVQDGK